MIQPLGGHKYGHKQGSNQGFAGREGSQAGAGLHFPKCRPWSRLVTLGRGQPSRRNGRGGEIRTHDLYVPNVALYQAKLRPDLLAGGQESPPGVAVASRKGSIGNPGWEG